MARILVLSCLIVGAAVFSGCQRRAAEPLPGETAAPEIVGVDVQGQAMRLSDFRGKVVVLTFWGTWCGPCRAMIPHERELVKRMQGKPFAFVGVSSDPPGQKLQSFVASNGITWPNFVDGGPDGPIARQYGVDRWPSIFVLDRNGVIRYRDVRGADLDRAVDTLLAKT